MSEEDAVWTLWDQFNRHREETIRVSATALAMVHGARLVGAGYKGGATVAVDRGALFEHLKTFCGSDFQGS